MLILLENSPAAQRSASPALLTFTWTVYKWPRVRSRGPRHAGRLSITTLCFETETLPGDSQTPAEVGRP